MNTRLHHLYEAYLDTKKQRDDLFRTYKENGETGTIEEKCNALFRQYQAKKNYLKQYHGKKYNTLYQTMITLRLKVIHCENVNDNVYKKYEKAQKDLFLDGSEI